MRIDSFEGGRLPPKSQIKSIRVTRDQFAAENHSADSFFVEVITQPGIGPIRTGRQVRLSQQRHERAQCLHADKRAKSRICSTGFNVGGGLIQNKASFFINVNGNSSYDTPNSSIARSTGTTRRDAEVPRAARFPVVERQFRLGGDARSDAAFQLQPRRLREQEPGHRPVRRPRARVRVGKSEQHVSRSGSGATRPPVLHQHAAQRRLDRFGAAVGGREADNPHPRRP